MLYMVTFTINLPPMLVYIPYMDPMGMGYGYNMCTCEAMVYEPKLDLKTNETNETLMSSHQELF